ncbi:MAG: protein translocase subunit SecDF [Bacteroidetes bacterium]|nr:protein translocase subunit SecDF [Bacteroidota bacterium]
MRQNRTISYILLLFIVICIYQFLFTFRSNSVEKTAKSVAEQKIKKTASMDEATHISAINNAKGRYLDSVSGKTALNLGIAKWTYQECKENSLNLGLDLQGGMNVVLQVNMKDLILSMSDYSRDPKFIQALNNAEKAQQTSNTDYITLFQNAYTSNNPNGKLATVFATRKYQDRIKFNTSNNEIIKLIRSESAIAVKNTYNIISSRIDKFGVKQPTVTLDEQRGRINVELAGVDNPQRVRNLLQATANLEFWETYKATELAASLNEANTALASYLEYEKSTTQPGVKKDSTGAITSSSASDFLTGGTDTGKQKSAAKPLADTSQKAKQAAAQKENPLWAKLYPSVDEKNQFVEGPIVGYANALDTAKVMEYLKVPEVIASFPPDIKFLWGSKSTSDKDPIFPLYAIRKTPNSELPPMDGSVVTNARFDVGLSGNEVSMRMNSQGADEWRRLTGANVGNFIAIVLDNYVYSAPKVNQEIAGGTSSISGDFTVEEATDLGNVLETGKLPAKADIVEEDVVGPTLGKEAINSGMLALLVAFILILVYMVAFYNNAGLIANIVLFINLFLIIGVMASLGSTLTLPGIAGIVLTLGMAVDANVIINERIREELRAGKSLKLAIPEGYKNSMSAILDGNITTLITAFILLAVGLGPIKGFATTLIIGILCSMFTAVLVAREFMEMRLAKGADLKFETPMFKNFLVGTNYDFLGKRKWAYIFSCCTIVFGLISFFTKGFEMGVDFKGGRDYKVRFEKNINTTALKSDLDATFGGGTVVKTYGQDNQIKASTSYRVAEQGETVDLDAETKLYEGCKKYLNGASFETFKSKNLMSSTKVAPTISAAIKSTSILAAVLALAAMFIYILIRFKKWQYSMGAIAATAHDTLFVLAIFSIFSNILPFSLEIDQAFIAAILTVIGYSINDTVIVFDRLREYLAEDPKSRIAGVCNKAINSTLTRTFNTALTTIFVVIVLFIFGGEAIRGFSFALILGIAIGTYSSIFIATPVMVDLMKDKEPEQIAANTKTTPNRKK